MRFGNLVRSRSILSSRREMRAHASRQFLVGGNWKCNGSVESVKTLVSDLNAGTFPSNVEVVCAPTFVHLPMVKDSLDPRFQISAQNCWTEPGAFTGEISADMLANMGIPWVITGHSERRALCGESSENVGEKTAYALGKGLKVIACVGESLPQRESGELWNVLSEQMGALKDSVSLSDWANMVIAYEPIWAIGTGVVASPEQAQVRITYTRDVQHILPCSCFVSSCDHASIGNGLEGVARAGTARIDFLDTSSNILTALRSSVQEVHAFLRNWLSDNVAGSVGASVRILYGGSVKGANAAELSLKEDIDGFLVGGASLDGKEFVTICNAPAAAASAAA